MNPYLEIKNQRYKIVSKTDCFLNKLIGLATIELNITELCSRKCSFCPRFDSSVYKNQKLFMSIDTAQSLRRNFEIENYEGDVSFVGFGEPMMHPNLPELISLFSKNYTVVITNGDFLNKESLKDLLDAGLKKLVVSCYDGPEERDKFKTLLSPTSIDWYVKELWGDFNTIVKTNDFNSRTGLIPSITKSAGGKCYIPFYKLFIDWNGDVVLCSEDWHRLEKGLGNINTTSLRDIWFGEKINKIRKDLSAGNRCGNACKNCNVNGILMGQDSFNLLSSIE